MKKIIILGLFVILLILSGCSNEQTKLCPGGITISIDENCPIPSKTIQIEEDYETIKIPCDGPGGSSFYLLKEKNSYDIGPKISCGSVVEVLERACVQNDGSYEGDMLELDKIKYAQIEGWVPRSYLTCKNIDCDYAPDSVC